MNKKSIFLLILLSLNLIIPSLLLLPIKLDNSDLKSSSILSAITIDGKINETGWTEANHKVAFYIDADPANTDGYNYLYVGQDANNLFIALDLSSDTSGDPNGEWFGIWLITNNKTFSNVNQWKNYNNDGTECIVYNVTADDIWNHDIDGSPNPYVACYNTTLANFELEWGFSDSPNNATSHRIVEIRIPKSEIELFDPTGYLGILVGGYGTMSFNNNDYWIHPMPASPDGYYEEDSSTYLYLDMFPILIDGKINETAWDFVQHKKQFWIDADTANTDGYNYLYVGEGPNSLYIAIDLASDTTGSTSKEWIGLWLITNNRTFSNVTQFVSYNNNGTECFVYNMTADDVWNATIDPGGPHGPGGTTDVDCFNTTLTNFEFKWGFYSSPNNGTDHRIFEMKIPKSEIELFDTNGYLGILIGGYGTLSYDGYGYWVYPKYNYFPDEYSPEYLYLDMTKPITSNGDIIEIPGYDLYIIISIFGFGSIVFIFTHHSRRLKLNS